MIDFLFFIIDTVTDFFYFKDEQGVAWKRFGCKIGGSAVMLLGILCLIPDATLARVLGWILIAAGFGLIMVGDELLIKHIKERE